MLQQHKPWFKLSILFGSNTVLTSAPNFSGDHPRPGCRALPLLAEFRRCPARWLGQTFPCCLRNPSGGQIFDVLKGLQKTHYFTSSDPHCDRLCCHSFWHLMWKHTFWHSSLAFYLTFNSDILYWHSIRPVYLAFFLGIHSDVLFWHSIQHLFWPSLWHWALPDLRERQIPVLTYQSNIPMAAASTAPEVPEFRGIAWGWLHLPLRDTRVGSVLYNPYRTHIIPNINDDISCILNTHTHIYIYIYIYISFIHIYI